MREGAATFRVPFTFASSPLSENLEQANADVLRDTSCVPSPRWGGSVT